MLSNSLTNSQYLRNQDPDLTDLTFKNKKILFFILICNATSFNAKIGTNGQDFNGCCDCQLFHYEETAAPCQQKEIEFAAKIFWFFSSRIFCYANTIGASIRWGTARVGDDRIAGGDREE